MPHVFKLITNSRLLAVALGTMTAAVALAVADGELRTWTDSTGKFKVEARFVSQEKDKVTLKDKDGKLFEIETAKLSADDRKHLAELAKAPMPDDPFKPVGSGKTIAPDWSGVRQVDTAASGEWKVAASPVTYEPVKSPAVALPERQNWEASADNLPKRVQLEEGETLEQHLKKLERPNYGFYQTVDVPRVLHRTAGPHPIGTSTVSANGVK